ncbi:unnamed protein product [Durusdinium trenchii]|uniref:Inosine/uridine-preferring nucleoside hydrolase domain-containing protein n=1 Tax=Durusdinium trenchii TaxID=1381693 RepID=A0ABP0NZI8_9DINO
MALPAKLACFDPHFTWVRCCAPPFGPFGNVNCWSEGYDYDTCCKLTFSNQNDADIPYLFTEILRAEFRPPGKNYSLDLQLHQRAAQLGTPASSLMDRFGSSWPAGLLWTGSYQLLRWYECSADLSRSMWSRREYIEFGAGIGASGIAAAFNGAFVTLVDAFVTEELLQNLQVNLPSALRSRVAICQMNWTQPLQRNLVQLQRCVAPRVPRLKELKFDLIGCGTSIYGQSHMMPLIHAISKPRTRVFIAPSVSFQRFMARWGRPTSRYFQKLVVRKDLGLTTVHRHSSSFSDKTPTVELRLVVADSFGAWSHACAVAKFLRLAGRSSQVPELAIGPQRVGRTVMETWATAQDLKAFPGQVRSDAPQAIIEQVQAAARDDVPLQILVLSPSFALAAALREAPWIAQKAQITAMGGSLWHGTNGTGPPLAEWSVKADVASSLEVYPHVSRLCPLDVAGTAQIDGAEFQELLNCQGQVPVVKALLEMLPSRTFGDCYFIS